MTTFDASSAQCRIFTFKEGMLSAVAHDLEIDVTRFTVAVEGTSKVSARLEAGSLRVLHALKEGQPTQQLAAGDRAKIEKTIGEDVLEVRRYPEIRFEATASPRGDGYTLTGELVLHGKARPLTLEATRKGDRLVAQVTLHQPDFGIKPYSAMLGALKVQADVKITVSVPWPPQG